MTINNALNLVIPIRTVRVEKPDPDNKDEKIFENETLISAYHSPISVEVFQANYRIIAATKHALWGRGWKFAAENGAKIAGLSLRDAAKLDAAEYDTPDTGPAFLAEIKRLTSILAPGTNGYDILPVDIAIAKTIIDEEEWAEAESTLVFFTLAYAMSNRSGRDDVAKAMALVMKGSIVSSSPTEYVASLATSSKTTVTRQAPIPQ